MSDFSGKGALLLVIYLDLTSYATPGQYSFMGSIEYLSYRGCTSNPYLLLLVSLLTCDNVAFMENEPTDEDMDTPLTHP